MEVVFMRYGWVLLVAGMLLNIPFLWRRVRPHIAAHPELVGGYRLLLFGLATGLSLPWLVMGFGCVVGGVPTIFHFLSPASGGPFVWTFWVVVYAEFLLVGYWVVFGGGAEILVRYPGVMNFQFNSASRLK